MPSTWKADLAKIIIAVNYFDKRSIVDVCHGFEYAIVLNIPGFWIWQGSENTRIEDMRRFEYAKVLNIPRF